jgi:hypothetical protein
MPAPRGIEAVTMTNRALLPPSHPFVERLIGAVRRELLDQVPFWTSTDL